MQPTSGVISEAWNLYKTHWRHLLSIALVVYLGVAIIGVLLVRPSGFFGKVQVTRV